MLKLICWRFLSGWRPLVPGTRPAVVAYLVIFYGHPYKPRVIGVVTLLFYIIWTTVIFAEQAQWGFNVPVISTDLFGWETGKLHSGNNSHKSHYFKFLFLAWGTVAIVFISFSISFSILPWDACFFSIEYARVVKSLNCKCFVYNWYTSVWSPSDMQADAALIKKKLVVPVKCKGCLKLIGL